MDKDQYNLIVILDKMQEFGYLNEENKNIVLDLIESINEYDASYWTDLLLNVFQTGFDYGVEYAY